MKGRNIYHFGQRIPEEALLFPAEDQEVGIFETLRAYRGRVFKAPAHIQRFLESAQTTGYSLRENKASLHKQLSMAVEAYLKSVPSQNEKNDFFIRMTAHDGKVYFIIHERTRRNREGERGVCLRTSPVQRSLSQATFPEAKSAAYQNGVLASLQPQNPNTFEWLFLSQNGYVTEVRVGNIFAVGPHHSKKRGPSFKLITPPTLGILNGVTRRIVINCALQIGLPVEETFFTRHDLWNAKEAFLTNTSWEILPIKALDGRSIGHTVPGGVTQQLTHVFHNHINEDLS